MTVTNMAEARRLKETQEPRTKASCKFDADPLQIPQRAHPRQHLAVALPVRTWSDLARRQTAMNKASMTGVEFLPPFTDQSYDSPRKEVKNDYELLPRERRGCAMNSAARSASRPPVGVDFHREVSHL